MDIFEQYGIKEVADVCLYAIELDENDKKEVLNIVESCPVGAIVVEEEITAEEN